ncbi:MAG: MptD family putative ECF transporter S component [Clostridiales Family XIII bacterium]|jgi:energy-coupling factor transport system substrate-specific component|nr:MptD family putative ECF transporter S component [Clostridiales Family XIII bacterium]
MNNAQARLRAGDLITTGIFTLLFFVVVFVFAMLFTTIPLMQPFIVCADAVFGGAIFLYLATKVRKFGAVSIMSFIIGLVMCLAGHFWPCLIFGAVFGLLADFLCSRGGYKKFAWNTAGYAAMMLGIALDGYSPMLFFEETFRQSRLDMGMSGEIIQQILDIIRGPMIIAAFAGAVICSVIGALIGKALLKKHFEKAGLL